MSVKDSPREKILEIIKNNPGVHFRAIQRESGFAIGQVEYHLYKLERDEEITVRKDGKFKRYFPYSTSDSLKKALGFYLRNKTSRNIIFLLLNRGEATSGRIKERVGENWEDSIKELISDGIIIEENSRYKLRNPEGIREFIKRSRKSFLEELADSLIDLFDDWKED